MWRIFDCFRKTRHRPSAGGDFPANFRVQRVSASHAKLVTLTPAEIVQYFATHPVAAESLLLESYDKRYAPSTFLSEHGDSFQVGWYARAHGYECVQDHASLADAATDYLLFSLGKQRWRVG